MEADIAKMLGDYVLAAVFLVLYVRSQMELAKVYREIAEQRRTENSEMRSILAELARQNIRNPLEDTAQFRAYKARTQTAEK